MATVVTVVATIANTAAAVVDSRVFGGDGASVAAARPVVAEVQWKLRPRPSCCVV